MITNFTEWMKIKESMGNQPDLYSAREGIKNTLANMRSDPNKWLGSGLSFSLDKVKGNHQAEKIIQNMQNVAMRFSQEIRNQNLGIMQRQGNISRPRMPNRGEEGYEEYQQLYNRYSQELYSWWEQLDKLASTQRTTPSW